MSFLIKKVQTRDDVRHDTQEGLKQIPSFPRKEDDNEVNKTGSDQDQNFILESQTQQ